MITMNSYGRKVGETKQTKSGTVTYVDGAADITYSKVTADYKPASRKYIVSLTGTRYATLEGAAAAVIRARAPTQDQWLAALGPCGK